MILGGGDQGSATVKNKVLWILELDAYLLF